MFIRYEEMFLLAVSKLNSNASLVFEFLYKLVTVFKAYFDKLDEESLRENFSLVYELLDEIVDFGYPQNMEFQVLKLIIAQGGLKDILGKSQVPSGSITKQVTGAVSWRPEGIKYRKNELFLDVIENVNMLMSSKGSVLSSDVTGKILMKCFLSGMPECKFGLNDKLMLAAEKKRSQAGKRYKEIDIDDTTFHQCVKLGNYEQDRTISFTPPDGEFELMRYRITDNIVPPFRLLSPIVREVSKTRYEVQVTIKSVFQNRLFGKNVVVKIPTPKGTAKSKVHVATGKAKYRPETSAIHWSIKRFPGDTELSLSAEVELISSTLEAKKWSRPPISLEFQVPMFTASGLHVRFLKVYEKSNYQAVKWVRYVTQAGNYENRI
jgi:AP-2 complex subunit mu-1